MTRKRKKIQQASANVAGVSILIVVAVVWSSVFLGGGLWQLTQRLRRQPQPSQQLYPQNFNQVENVPAGLFSYSGSATWASIRLTVDSAIKSARPEFQLRYVQVADGAVKTTGAGIQMLLDDRLTLMQSARPLYETEHEQAEKRGFRLKQIPVAIDGISVAVHPSLQLAGLTLNQLRLIYSGQINNWKQVGGPDLGITPYSPPTRDSGTADFFVEDILRGRGFGTTVQFIPTTTQALRTLANNRGGIYYASAPEIIPQCSVKAIALGRKSGEWVAPYQEPSVPPSACPSQRNRINLEVFRTGRYPITRYLYVIVKANGRIEEKAGEAYANFLLTPQGQNLISASGFVSIR